jgi:hypothetical protein
VTRTFFRPALDPTTSRDGGVSALIDALRAVEPNDEPPGDALICAVVAASDRDVVAMLEALHRLDSMRQWLGAIAVGHRIARDADEGVHWSPVHDTIMALEHELVDGLRLRLRDGMIANLRAMWREGDRLDLLTVLELLQFESFDLKCQIVCKFARSPMADVPAWAAACAAWPPAAALGALGGRPREWSGSGAASGPAASAAG